MERTLISVNIPNAITANLMVWGGLFLAALIWQLVTRGRGQAATAA